MSVVRRAAGAVALVAALLTGCGNTPPAAPSSDGATTIRIASLRGPTTMGLVTLMSDAEEGPGAQDYEVTMYGTADEVVPLLVQGEVDVALLPANLASVLYHRTMGEDGSEVAVAAITTLGVLEVLESGTAEVQTIADLEGRTIHSTGKGTTPEYVLDYLLEENGLDPEADVAVEFASESTEVAAVLAATPGAVGVLPQPYATVLQAQHPEIRTALRLVDEWAAVTPDSAMVTGVVVLRTAFAQAHPSAVADFLDDLAASTAVTNEHPEQAAPLVAEAGITPTAQVAEAAIPACSITYIDGADLTTLLGGYLEVLVEADPAAVGGSLPGDDFYYEG